MQERHTNAPVCGKNATHGRMAIEIQPVMGYVQGGCHYICPVTRKEVTSHRQRTNIMRENNMVDANDLNPVAAFAKAERDQQDTRDKIRAIRKDLTTGTDRPFTDKELTQLVPPLPQLEQV